MSIPEVHLNASRTLNGVAIIYLDLIGPNLKPHFKVPSVHKSIKKCKPGAVELYCWQCYVICIHCNWHMISYVYTTSLLAIYICSSGSMNMLKKEGRQDASLASTIIHWIIMAMCHLGNPQLKPWTSDFLTLNSTKVLSAPLRTCHHSRRYRKNIVMVDITNRCKYLVNSCFVSV